MSHIMNNFIIKNVCQPSFQQITSLKELIRQLSETNMKFQRSMKDRLINLQKQVDLLNILLQKKLTLQAMKISCHLLQMQGLKNLQKKKFFKILKTTL